MSPGRPYSPAEDPEEGMSLKFRPVERTPEPRQDVIPFPGRPVSRIGRWDPAPARVPHEAERAIDRMQRRLDNLREIMGPEYVRGDDGPKAA